MMNAVDDDRIVWGKEWNENASIKISNRMKWTDSQTANEWKRTITISYIRNRNLENEASEANNKDFECIEST